MCAQGSNQLSYGNCSGVPEEAAAIIVLSDLATSYTLLLWMLFILASQDVPKLMLSLSEWRDSTDFTDVTLVSEDAY